jgi:hypothetical protein
MPEVFADASRSGNDGGAGTEEVVILREGVSLTFPIAQIYRIL